MNRELYGQVYDIPDNILNKLQSYSGNERVKNLIDKKQISYSNLKKFLHDMKNGEKDSLGGEFFENWVSNTLSTNRDNSTTSKRAKMKSGQENAFINTHEKRDKNSIRPSERHRKSSERHSSSTDNSFLKLEQRVIDELKIINEIMKKLI